jgi:carbon-monoxide dehydrogenase small subunit
MRIALTVNGRPVEADVPPRTSLADLLREHLLLTGTHLGCEHGICGACTVEIDGEIARSCITWAVGCDGTRVRTIEGFDEDALMARLRRAFAQAHALQCGYCTPGMLIAARDLVRRKSGLSRPEIRREMSGNLCRCTGYMGIVDAISHVMAEAGVRPCAPEAGADPMARSSVLSEGTRWLGPAPGPGVAPAAERQVEPGVSPGIRRGAGSAPAAPRPPADREPVHVTTGGIEVADGGIRLAQSFVLEHPREAVWALMSDPEAVALCMPGARLDGPPQNGTIAGRIEVRLGPIVARFAGTGSVRQIADEYRQVIEGHGADRRSGSRVTGSVDYRLTAVSGASGGQATRIDLAIGYALTGLLAQIGRSGLARDLAQRIGEAFAQNLDARLRAEPGAAAPPARLSAVTLILAAMRARLRAFLARLRGA